MSVIVHETLDPAEEEALNLLRANTVDLPSEPTIEEKLAAMEQQLSEALQIIAGGTP